MEHLIIYTRVCLPCKMGRELRKVKAFAKKNNLEVTIIRVTSTHPHLTSDITMPYVYFKNNKTALALPNVTYDDLAELITIP